MNVERMVWEAFAESGQPVNARHRLSKVTYLTRVVHEVDDDLIERVLLRWQTGILEPRQDRSAIVDGKGMRHFGVEIVNAVDTQERFLGSVVADSNSNEISATRKL